MVDRLEFLIALALLAASVVLHPIRRVARDGQPFRLRDSAAGREG